MKDLTVVLMCHNRTKSAVEAITSIINQSEKNFDFLVSDNSTNKDLQEILKKDFPKIKSLFWSPYHETLYDHFNILISKIKTEYIVLFHDDDLMHENYVEKILKAFKDYPQASAIATNGKFFAGKTLNQTMFEGSFFKSDEESLSFNDKGTLLERYLSWDSGGIAPFTSYAYNLSKICDLRADFGRGRLYCDTFFILDVLDRGEIIWINKPLVKVRAHKGQVSEACDVRDYKNFITTITRELKGEVNQFFIDEYRFRNLLYRLRKRKHFPFPAIKFFLRMIPLLFFRSKAFRKKVFATLLRGF